MKIETDRKLLKAMEWSSVRRGQGSGYMSSGNDGPLVRACPMCGGIDPQDSCADHFMDDAQGHRENCELHRLLLTPKRKKHPNPAAQAMAQLRKKKLSRKRRREIARMGAAARWSGHERPKARAR